MGKKAEPKKSESKSGTKRCGGCTNFDPHKKGGYCRRRDKKRPSGDEACGHFDPR